MAPLEHNRNFMFLDGRRKDRKAVQSFINSGRSKSNVWHMSVTARSTAPLGWANKPQDTSAVGLAFCGQSATPRNSGLTSQVLLRTEFGYQESLERPDAEQARSTQSRSPPDSNEVTPSPLTSTGRKLISVDPFANLPIKLDHSSQSLYCFSIAFLTEDCFATTFTNPALTRAIGPSYHYNSEIRLCTTLLQASAYLDSIREGGTSKSTLQWKVASLQCLGRLISSPATRYGVDALNGAVSLLLFESMAPDSPQCYLHSRAVMQVLSHRAGTGCLSDHIDVALAIITSKAQVLYLDHLQASPAGLEEARLWNLEVDFLINTLRGLSEWVIHAQHVFSTGRKPVSGPLSELLQNNFDNPLDDFELSYQIFVLSYLSMVLWGCHDPANCTELLRIMSARHSKLDLGRTCSHAVWVCIQDMDGKWDLQFQAIRLTKVFHRLSRDMQFRVKSFFMGLCEAAIGLTLLVVLSEADFVRMRQEAIVRI
jgi:hypothetical protein